MDPVILIKLIFRSVIPKDLQIPYIELLHALRRFGNGNTFSFAYKQRHLVEGDLHIVMSRGQLFPADGTVRHKFHEQHLLGQIHIASLRILGIDRCNHDLIPKHQLILHLQRLRILRILKGQRLEIHIVGKRRLHVLTVKIGDQAVTHSHHMAEILRLFKLIAFLLSGSDRRMVPHKGREHAKGKPAEQKVSRGVGPESAQIRSRVQKAAHIQGRHHFQVQQKMGPP